MKSDFKHLYATQKAVNSGDDVAGYVSAVGEDVEDTGEFRIGDRVAGFHKMLLPGGAYAEFAVVPAHTAFFIPESVSFEGKSLTPWWSYFRCSYESRSCDYPSHDPSSRPAIVPPPGSPTSLGSTIRECRAIAPDHLRRFFRAWDVRSETCHTLKYPSYNRNLRHDYNSLGLRP